MRNLRIIGLEEVHVGNELPLTATAWDPNTDSIVCTFGPTEEKALIQLKRIVSQQHNTREQSNGASEITLIASWDSPCPLPDLPCDEVLLLQYFPDTSTICLVLAGGDLIVVRDDPLPEQEKIEIVGSVDTGISAAAWAPDEEVLAIVTKADTLILMSRDFEPLKEAILISADLQASKHVSVGWGKKETQFQGKRAKALRDPTIPEKVDEGKLSERDDGRTGVSWRGDGAFLAVNSIVPGHRRVIRVFSRDATLDSVSEPVDNLESTVSWRPSGQIIAGIQRFKDRVDVIFFERNGLRHGEFRLRLSKEEMDTMAFSISLSWNNDSSVLAVMFLDRVQFWSMGNYHYYLKQEILFHDNHLTTPANGIRWHPEGALKCSIQAPTSVMSVEHAFAVSRGSVTHPDDHGIVAVIDGKCLKITPFKHASVPPPMSFCEVIAEANIIDVAINQSGDVIALLTNNYLEIHKWNFEKSPKATVEKPNHEGRPVKIRPLASTSQLASYQLNEIRASISPNRFTQVAIVNDQVVVLAPNYRLESPCIKSFQLNEETNLSSSVSLVYFAQDKAPANLARNLITDVLQTAVWIQGPSGAHKLGLDSSYTDLPGALPGAVAFLAPNGCRKCGLFGSSEQLNSLSDPNCKHFHHVSLSGRGELIVDSQIIARGCTSFLLTNIYLLFTTSRQLLKFVHLGEPTEMTVPSDTPDFDERCRNIERGAKLITVVPASYSVVLQMPRGNLETVYPRVLVLSGIRRHILNRDYKAAFLACQTHQVDPNILYDYQPELFMNHISLFLSQLKKVSRIDEFLSKLKDEDVTETIYKSTLPERIEINGTNAPAVGGPRDTRSSAVVLRDKVNRICHAVLGALSNNPAHLQNIITAHVCKRPPDYTSALTLISELRHKSPSDADSAVSHLCFLVDANRLYDTALSLYDLELTLLVAQNSQRDPREYLPFLQSLQSQPELRRRYQINNHLKYYSRALSSLHSLGAHEELVSYTKKHNLYVDAMALYKYDPPRLRQISILYASHLASISQNSAAAMLYESLGDYKSAYPLHALAHRWREALTCATLVPLESSTLKSLALSLATTLTEENRDYRSAAAIHTDYLSDPTTAARQLCKGSYFAEATRLLTLHGLFHEIRNTVHPGLNEKFSEVVELLSDCKSQLDAQLPRILELRRKEKEDPLAFFGGDPTADTDLGADIPDNVSLAPTDASTAGGQSLFTRYGSHASTRFGGTVASHAPSHKTSKTKRREERKRARGKKGSVYEEEYLVGSVKRLVERVNGVHDEVGRLVEGLMRSSFELQGRERAEQVGERMAGIVGLCESAIAEIWKTDLDTSGRQGENTANDALPPRPPGADGVYWDSQLDMDGLQIGRAPMQPPEVKSWRSGLSSL